ncbi:MAG: lamin tail domain-containing protein, partial [Bacteroidota bacterium]
LANGGADREVKITAAPGGYVVLNHNIRIDETSLRGSYFANLPLHLRAVAHLGFRFTGWEGRTGGPAFSMSLKPEGPHERTALFEPLTHSLAEQLRISELSPSSTDGDWLELFNGSEQTIDLQGWVLTDRTHEVRLPKLEIRSGERLLLAEHPEKFTTKANCHQLPFGLGKEEETIGLYSPEGAFVDLVQYDLAPPPGDFVLLPGNNGWYAEEGNGSPGRENPLLHVGTVTGSSYWTRLAIGGAILLLVVLIRVYTASEPTKAP